MNENYYSNMDRRTVVRFKMMETYNYFLSCHSICWSSRWSSRLPAGTFIYQPPGGAFLPNANVTAILTRWAAFFKTYRTLLSADVIHVRRPDGQGLDVIVHVLPGATIPAMIIVSNPTAADISAAGLKVCFLFSTIPHVIERT